MSVHSPIPWPPPSLPATVLSRFPNTVSYLDVTTHPFLPCSPGNQYSVIPLCRERTSQGVCMNLLSWQSGSIVAQRFFSRASSPAALFSFHRMWPTTLMTCSNHHKWLFLNDPRTTDRLKCESRLNLPLPRTQHQRRRISRRSGGSQSSDPLCELTRLNTALSAQGLDGKFRAVEGPLCLFYWL